MSKLSRGKVHSQGPGTVSSRTQTKTFQAPPTQAGPTRIGKQAKYGSRKGIKPPGRINTTRGTS